MLNSDGINFIKINNQTLNIHKVGKKNLCNMPYYVTVSHLINVFLEYCFILQILHVFTFKTSHFSEL